MKIISNFLKFIGNLPEWIMLKSMKSTFIH
jgi:hypothetical protein